MLLGISPKIWLCNRIFTTRGRRKEADFLEADAPAGGKKNQIFFSAGKKSSITETLVLEKEKEGRKSF